MSIPSNFDRATWAANAIERFRHDTGNLSDEEAVHDLICDLGHYCRLYDLDFLRLVANGISTWCAEIDDPDGFRLDPGPDVSIVIPGRKCHPRKVGAPC
jgi:hypothetical protein